MEEKLKVVKDLLPGPEGSSNEFQDTAKEQVKTEGKQNSTHKAASQSLPKQPTDGSEDNIPDHIAHRYYKAQNKVLTNECEDVRKSINVIHYTKLR